jgi:hypothetical protein
MNSFPSDPCRIDLSDISLFTFKYAYFLFGSKKGWRARVSRSRRIFAVSDVVDALTSHRPHKKPLTFEETMGILEQGRGEHFAPAVLNAFGKIARGLCDRHNGHEGEDLKDEMAAVLMKYISAGMEMLHYGDGKQWLRSKRTAKRFPFERFIQYQRVNIPAFRKKLLEDLKILRLGDTSPWEE